jgi:hypothetical protein
MFKHFLYASKMLDEIKRDVRALLQSNKDLREEMKYLQNQLTLSTERIAWLEKKAGITCSHPSHALRHGINKDDVLVWKCDLCGKSKPGYEWDYHKPD